MTIIVYSKSNCVQCIWTKKKLTQLELEYSERNIESDETARKAVEDSGNRQLPMVEVIYQDRLIDRWHGFNPDRITWLTTRDQQ